MGSWLTYGNDYLEQIKKFEMSQPTFDSTDIYPCAFFGAFVDTMGLMLYLKKEDRLYGFVEISCPRDTIKKYFDVKYITK